MKFAVVSYSSSGIIDSYEKWSQNLITEINDLISQGSEVILYPELFLLNLHSLCQKQELTEQLQEISSIVQEKLLPDISKHISKKDIVLCLGSFSRLVSKELFNSAPLFHEGKWIFQDKINLTPWETSFTPGREVNILNFKGLKLATLICFDVEQLSLGKLLKDEGIEILLVPSATSNKNGNERINRCASARAIELGAIVLTSPLVGDSPCDLIDHNEGQQGMFLPAQDAITDQQVQYSTYSKDQKIIHFFECDMSAIKDLKKKTEETKPFLHKEVEIIKAKMI